MERLFQIFTETSKRFFSKNLASSGVKREKKGIEGFSLSDLPVPTPNPKNLRTIILAVFIFVCAHEFRRENRNTVNTD